MSLEAVVRTDDPTTLALAELGDGGSVARYRFYSAGHVGPRADVGGRAQPRCPTNVATLFVGTLGLVLEPMASAYEAVVDRLSGTGTLVAVDPNCRPGSSPTSRPTAGGCGGCSSVRTS